VAGVRSVTCLLAAPPTPNPRACETSHSKNFVFSHQPLATTTRPLFPQPRRRLKAWSRADIAPFSEPFSVHPSPVQRGVCKRHGHRYVSETSHRAISSSPPSSQQPGPSCAALLDQPNCTHRKTLGCRSARSLSTANFHAKDAASLPSRRQQRSVHGASRLIHTTRNRLWRHGSWRSAIIISCQICRRPAGQGKNLSLPPQK